MKYGGYELYEKSGWDTLIRLGDIFLYKERKKNYSNCKQRETRFNYHGIENALCGKTNFWRFDRWKGEYFTPKGILVIQMK